MGASSPPPPAAFLFPWPQPKPAAFLWMPLGKGKDLRGGVTERSGPETPLSFLPQAGADLVRFSLAPPPPHPLFLRLASPLHPLPKSFRHQCSVRGGKRAQKRASPPPLYFSPLVWTEKSRQVCKALLEVPERVGGVGKSPETSREADSQAGQFALGSLSRSVTPGTCNLRSCLPALRHASWGSSLDRPL